MKYFNWQNKIDDEELVEVVKVLNNGGIVIFPTETLFALVGNACDNDVVNKIYEIKKRPTNKPFSIFVKNINDINKVAIIKSAMEQKIIENFMPGSITLILRKKENVSNLVTANLNEVGIRIPSNDIALKILYNLDIPLVSTSANISNEDNLTNIEDLIEVFKNDVDIIINGTINKNAIPSTVLKIQNDEIKILRQGCVSGEEIKNILKEN